MPPPPPRELLQTAVADTTETQTRRASHPKDEDGMKSNPSESSGACIKTVVFLTETLKTLPLLLEIGSICSFCISEWSAEISSQPRTQWERETGLQRKMRDMLPGVAANFSAQVSPVERFSTPFITARTDRLKHQVFPNSPRSWNLFLPLLTSRPLCF